MKTKTRAEKPKPARFVNLLVHAGFLHALDEAGGVWKYCPATESRYAL